jgi:cyclomaltodextrinase / maltogenic alpha-amylase / neopullulanase
MTAHSWDAPEWARYAVFYHIFPERFFNGDTANDPAGTVSWDSVPTRENFFGGDLAGIRARLDYLQQLGITALYCTPFFRAQTNHRYDISDYFAIDPAAGTLDDFHGLVRDLNARDMRLILDAVFNHCGDGFDPFQDVCQNGPNSSYWEWFTVRGFPVEFDPPNFQTCGGAPFLPKLNTEHPAVRDYLLRVTRYWLEQGADGWRLDVPWKVPLSFWREFRRAALETRPDAYLVAEEWRSAWPWQAGDTVHGVMNYRLRNAILDYCAWDHMDAEDFDYELACLRQEHGPAAPYHLTLLGSHDTPRFLTLCGEDVKRMLIAVVFQMTYIGIPLVYYGDEIGMVGDNDPLCRAGMIWDASRQNRRLHAAYQKLIQLRHRHRALTDGTFEPVHVFNGVYAYQRVLDDDMVIVVLNPRDARADYTVSLPTTSGTAANQWYEHLTGQTFTPFDNTLVFDQLPAQSAFVLTPDATR